MSDRLLAVTYAYVAKPSPDGQVRVIYLHKFLHIFEASEALANMINFWLYFVLHYGTVLGEEYPQAPLWGTD